LSTLQELVCRSIKATHHKEEVNKEEVNKEKVAAVETPPARRRNPQEIPRRVTAVFSSVEPKARRPLSCPAPRTAGQGFFLSL